METRLKLSQFYFEVTDTENHNGSYLIKIYEQGGSELFQYIHGIGYRLCNLAENDATVIGLTAFNRIERALEKTRQNWEAL